AVAALQFLRRPFRHEVEPAGRLIHVSAGASGFVPLGAVPPAFVRMLLMAEDAGFFGHPGIDVAEIPAAWAENLERGRFKRGASTITQQLARNLFLSRDKTYGRKMEEAALALALDAAVPKARLLEIYLNVIEWGPGVYGLGPAARHYFGKAPSQLTTREMAFLVCLVPSPVRYHSAHRAGQAGPGMTQLMDNLLAKMHAAGALDDDGYAQALSDVLVFAPEEGEATARTAG
ncbi:MAG TPA: biosynthetic peptidoglycan transglycosylase, partial [Vicinamibacteria bacterium]|nr:biosynthetic peptidoglycan transglycosylase [Vicinamibacteria bacterium]